MRGAHGYSIMEILVAIGVLSVSLYLVTGTLNNFLGQLRRNDQGAAFQALRDTFLRTLQDPAAWQQTLARNPGFACWSNPAQGCAGVAPIVFTPYTSVGLLIENYDPSRQATQGFSVQGSACNTFRVSAPDGNCPVRVEFTARPICPPAPAPCFRPSFEVSVRFIFAFPAGAIAPSAGGLDRTIFIPGESVPVRLTSRTLPTVCPPGELVVGLDPANGVLQCASGAERIYNQRRKGGPFFP